MNKNFTKLEEYSIFNEEDQKEIFSNLHSLINNINNNELSNFGSTMRKTLEHICNAYAKTYLYEDLDGPLWSKIDQIKKNKNLPNAIYQAFQFIKSIGNKDSHSNKGRKNQVIEWDIDINEAKVSIKYIWHIIKWISLKNEELPKKEISKLDFLEDTKVFTNKKKYDEYKNLNEDIKPIIMTFSQLIFSNKYKFNIPTYQRDYTWGKKDIHKLFFDIKNRVDDQKTHYMGTLAIALDNENKKIRIIDGQQRISTFLIIFKTFYEVYKSKFYEDIPEDLEDFVEQELPNKYINEPVLPSQEGLTRVFKGTYNSSDKSIDKKAWENYRYIKSFLSPMDLSDLEIHYKTFITKFQATILTFSTTIQNEMDIFLNLNTGGVKLTSWDLIRSYIFSRLDDEEFLKNETIVNRYITKKFITPFNKNDKKIENFWNAYSRFMFIMKKEYRIYKPSSSDKYTVYEAFVKIWKLNGSDKKIKKLNLYMERINDISRILNLYLEVKENYKSKNSKLNKYAYILNLLNSKETSIPIVLYSLFSYSEIDDSGNINYISEKTKELLKILETYFVMSNQYGNNIMAPIDEFLRCFHTSNEDHLNEKLWSFFTKEISIPLLDVYSFSQKVESNDLTKEQRQNILFKIENHIKKSNLKSTNEVKHLEIIEQILAKNLKYKNYHDKGISEENFKISLKKFKDYIGNNLLISKEDDLNVKNKTFWDKKEFYINYFLANNRVNGIDLISLEEFTFENIKGRTKAIANYIIKNEIYYKKN